MTSSLLSHVWIRALRFVAACLSFATIGSVAAAQSGPVKHYLYVSVPDGAQDSLAEHAPGIAVFDIDDGHKFVRFIPVPQFSPPGSKGVSARQFGLRGFCASLVNHAAYYTAENGLLGCFDLETEKVLWEVNLPEGADRADITLDGKKLYVPTGWWDRGPGGGMFIVDARDGKVMKRVSIGPGAHNSFVTPDGQYLLIGGIEWFAMFRTANDEKILYLDDVGDGGMFPFTVDGRNQRAYLSRTKHVGVDIVDLKLGERTHVIQDGLPPIPRRTHGVALTPDEKELWLSDQAGKRLLVYDNTVVPPVKKQDIKLVRDGHGWVLFSMDGRYAWCHTEEVIDTKTKQVVAILRDEKGRLLAGSKYFEVHLQGKKVVAVGSQFPIGRVTQPATR
jgi:DNA-binding beta-propeller fold protein YncE